MQPCNARLWGDSFDDRGPSSSSSTAMSSPRLRLGPRQDGEGRDCLLQGVTTTRRCCPTRRPRSRLERSPDQEMIGNLEGVDTYFQLLLLAKGRVGYFLDWRPMTTIAGPTRRYSSASTRACRNPDRREGSPYRACAVTRPADPVEREVGGAPHAQPQATAARTVSRGSFSTIERRVHSGAVIGGLEAAARGDTASPASRFGACSAHAPGGDIARSLQARRRSGCSSSQFEIPPPVPPCSGSGERRVRVGDTLVVDVEAALDTSLRASPFDAAAPLATAVPAAVHDGSTVSVTRGSSATADAGPSGPS